MNTNEIKNKNGLTLGSLTAVAIIMLCGSENPSRAQPKASDDVRHVGDCYAHGYLLGRPVKESYKGTIFVTHEMTISLGDIGQTPYIGGNVDVSTEVQRRVATGSEVIARAPERVSWSPWIDGGIHQRCVL